MVAIDKLLTSTNNIFTHVTVKRLFDSCVFRFL